jgi:hypothetical protein
MKKTKILLLLANLIIAVIIFVTVNEKNDQKKDLASEIGEILSNLHSISISDPKSNGHVRVVKKEQDWVLNEPFYWEAEELVLSNFTTKFAHLSFKELYTTEEIEKQGEIIDDYGVDANSTTVQINALNTSLHLTIGKETRDQESVYAEIKRSSDESKSIWAVSKDILDITNADPVYWGVATFINKPLYSIDEFSVTFRRDGNITSETRLEKINSEWNFVKPFNAQANKEKVLFFLNSLLSEKIKGFVHLPSEENSTVGEKTWEVMISVKSMGENEHIYLSSPSNDDKSARTAKSSTSSTVFSVNEDFVTKITDLSTQLRERTVFDLSLKTLQQIEIKKEENFLKMRKTNQDWFATEGNSTRTIEVESEKESIETFVRSLNQIRVNEFLAFNPNQDYLTANGFSSPKYILNIHKLDSTKQTILISESIEDASLSKIYNSEQSLVCLVDVNLVGILTTDSLPFRTKSVLPNDSSISAYDISTTDNQEVIYSSDRNSTELENNFISSFRVEAYISDKFKNDGAWVEGDWVPWKYKLSFTGSSTDDAKYDFFLSEKKGSTTWYCGSDKEDTTFNLPINIIEELSVKLEQKPTQNP